MLTTASKDEAGNGIDRASPHTNVKPGANLCRLHRSTASGEKSNPVIESWLQVAAYEQGAAAPSGAHLQDILVLQIRVVDRMEIQLDAQPIPFIRRLQRRDIDICRRGSIAVVHERPVRGRHTFRQGLITGSPHKSPDGHRPSYCSVESTAGLPTSATRRDRLHPSPTSLAGPPSDVGGPVSGRVASIGRVNEEPSWRPGMAGGSGSAVAE